MSKRRDQCVIDFTPPESREECLLPGRVTRSPYTVAEAASWRTPRQKDQFRDFAIFGVGPWQHVNWAETWQRVIGKLGPSEHNGGTSVCILVRTKEANTPLAPFFMLSTPISRCRDPRKGAKKRGNEGRADQSTKALPRLISRLGISRVCLTRTMISAFPNEVMADRTQKCYTATHHSVASVKDQCDE